MFMRKDCNTGIKPWRKTATEEDIPGIRLPQKNIVLDEEDIPEGTLPQKKRNPGGKLPHRKIVLEENSLRRRYSWSKTATEEDSPE